MAKASTRLEDIKLRFAQAAKFVWAMKSAGKEIPKTYIANTFHIGSNTARFLIENVTGKEQDIESITEELRERIKVLNREYGESLKPKDACAPEELVNVNTQEEKPQEASLDRLRAEIRAEIYAEVEARDQREFRYKREKIAGECLYRLVSARPKETPESLADKAVAIADNLLKILGGLAK